MNNQTKRLILIELNEVNFDVVSQYVASNPCRFSSLAKLLVGPKIITSSEKKYEELEPWIQWASVHTAKTYNQHGIFRLGDIVESNAPQIFEMIEKQGHRVGVISAMNAENRLKDPAYFIPDPWTRTPADSSWWSRSLGQAISQMVNDNAQGRVTVYSAVTLILGLLRFGQVKNYYRYIVFIAHSRRRPWLKSILLDLFLHDVHWAMFNSRKPAFSTLFLNAGAHIQHHYFFNAEPVLRKSSIRNPNWYVSESVDPLADVLDLYDKIVRRYFSQIDTEVILATGLSQKPYDRIKYYYRLKNHVAFLKELGIQFKGVSPRMTRDFLIEFDDPQQANAAQRIMSSVRVDDDGLPLFGDIDNRGKSLFVSLTYPLEIKSTTFYRLEDRKFQLKPKVSFVAIKNGMHQEKGFAFFTPGIASKAPGNGAHVAKLGELVLKYFDIDSLSGKKQSDASNPSHIDKTPLSIQPNRGDGYLSSTSSK